MSHPTETRRLTTRRLSPRQRILTGISVVAILTLGLFGASSLLNSSNTASALRGHPEILRPGCTWDSSGYYVQNCKVWSESQKREVIVQIRASSGSDSGVYLLDGMRASETRSAWTTDVQAARVYDAKANTTLVMPVGGASSFYTDWDGGAGDKNTVIKQETFLTSELPAYLEREFGVARNNNAIVGLSMSGGPAVTLAERHPEQFKVVQAMSGYYQTDNPIGALGVFATQSLVSNYVSGIVNMWGAPGGTRWTDNDPSKNVGKLAENGQVLIISSGNGFLTPTELAKLAPQDQISAIALEILSAVSTVLMQLQAKQSGASVISLPNYGGHTWENWGRALGDGKGHVLETLRNNPPVTAKTTVVSASGSPDPEGPAKVTMAVKNAAAASPALDASVLAALESTDASSASSETPASSESAASSEASDSVDPSTDVSTSAPAAPESAAAESAAPAEESAAATTEPTVPQVEPSAPSVSEQPAPSTATTTTPVR
ncbi:alpha/beta hydrolase family protein [Gordonia westfalica]|uniref:Alpha/beta hydrolase family protein n=1 Tax=Gordonia westfalica TaxID=158898 RepID=A0ABU2GLV3_9ACTN|nr:alpha/beta hydrolase family protein [Gordonia westfalica]MDS1112447.1 alpha/beta hydrolase family protein [Gordonia westfalica]